MRELDDDTSVRDPGEPGRVEGFGSSPVGEHSRSPGVPGDIPHPGVPGAALLPRTEVNRRPCDVWTRCHLVVDSAANQTSRGALATLAGTRS